MRTLQIGVIGSAADLSYSKELEEIAEEIGEEIAKKGFVLFYGAEKDVDSLSTAAARGAKRYHGLTVGVTYGAGKKIVGSEFTDVVIPTGLGRGGGREYILALCCDTVIGINGGSGTLNEFLAAYQNDIPLIGMRGTGGTTELFIEKPFDTRRKPMYGASTPKEAVDLAEVLAREYIQRFG
ncbi:LOG family protein [Candidatus Woesearchaeota archaeon]|nr:LOG family protein [Candidatus Woesearchaeota archaeon]